MPVRMSGPFFLYAFFHDKISFFRVINFISVDDGSVVFTPFAPFLPDGFMACCERLLI